MGFERNVILLLGRIEACRCGARRRHMELVVRQRRGQLADRTASHEAHPPGLCAGASVVEARRLARSVEVAATSRQRDGARAHVTGA